MDQPVPEPVPDAPLDVLLCDDSPELLALLRAELEDSVAVRVVGEATDGADALRLAAECRPEVIVLDLEMPGLPADELIVAVDRIAPTAAIVTFSGHEPADVVGPEAAARVDLHVPKVTDLSVLGSVLREVGRRRRAG
jgi:DNA-binding NarL/FixJ family response regulator